MLQHKYLLKTKLQNKTKLQQPLQGKLNPLP